MKLEYVIKNLIQNNKIKTQLELTTILQRKGIITTQSNISRILKKLHTVKIVDEDKNTYYIIRPRPLDLEEKVKSLVLNIENNGSLVTLKTYAGSAPVIAQILDERKLSKLLCTVAGDNAVLAIPEKVEDVDILYENVKNLFVNDIR